MFVMAGLVPAIHVSLQRAKQGVDARDKRGHDAGSSNANGADFSIGAAAIDTPSYCQARLSTVFS